MLDDVTGSFGLKFLLAAIVVGLALAAFFAAVTLIRKRGGTSLFGGSSFLAPMRGRRNRLQVLESVPVDARRRVLLIRRDNVEHLILIGGPQDVIIENGIEAPYEAAAPEEEEADDYYQARETEEPAPVRELEDRRTATRSSLGSAIGRGLNLRRNRAAAAVTPPEPAPTRYREWEDDGFDEDLIGDDLDLEAAMDDFDEPGRLADEPPVGTIRPVTVSRADRLAPANAPPLEAPSAPPAAREPQISDEEAALVRELEAARRRIQAPGPTAPAAPQSTHVPIGQSDFDRILEREMEAKLEAAKRGAQSPATMAAPPRPVVQQPRRDPNLPRITGAAPERSLESGIARIFGEGQEK